MYCTGAVIIAFFETFLGIMFVCPESAPPALRAAFPETSILDQLCVSPPYFALRALALDTGSARASVLPELAMGQEAGPMRAAEIGRHLAVLGACALAHANPEAGRHYYLAHAARLERVAAATTASGLHGGAVVESVEGRSASVQSWLEDDAGTVLYRLHVRYHVLPERSFRRLFASHARAPLGEADPDYYRRAPAVGLVTLDQEQLQARIGPFGAADFPGHFDGFPSLPASMLNAALIDCAGLLLAHHLGVDKARYAVLQACVEAAGMACAGDIVTLDVRLDGHSGDRYRFTCTGSTARGLEVGRLLLELQYPISEASGNT